MTWLIRFTDPFEDDASEEEVARPARREKAHQQPSIIAAPHEMTDRQRYAQTATSRSSLRTLYVVIPPDGSPYNVRVRSPSPLAPRLPPDVPSVPEMYQDVLNETLLDRCTARECRWDGCDAVLGSENTLGMHVYGHLASEKGAEGTWKMQLGVSSWIFTGLDSGRMKTEAVPNKYLYKCVQLSSGYGQG